MRTANYKYIAIALLLLAFNCAAQTVNKCLPNTSRLTAEKIDEFSHIDDNELYINVVVLFERLRTEPVGTYAYVIAYKGADAQAANINTQPNTGSSSLTAVKPNGILPVNGPELIAYPFPL